LFCFGFVSPSDEEEEEEDTSNRRLLSRPLFVKRDERVTVQEKEKILEEEEALEKQRLERLEQRQQVSDDHYQYS